jgi:hydrogenase small subunit
MTYNACGTIKWNNGISYPIQSGHGCFGCSEEDFWDNGPIYERMTGLHGFGIESSADTIGKVAAGALAGGIAVHAVAAAIAKRKEVEDRIAGGKKNEQTIDS